MKKTLLSLCLSFVFLHTSAWAGAQRDDEGLIDQSSISQEKELKKLEKHSDKISAKSKSHVGHATPGGWKISDKPKINDAGNIEITAKKDGKVSTVEVDKKKIQNKIGLSHKVKSKTSGGKSLLFQIISDISQDIYGKIDNLAIVGDHDASWFDKLYHFIFNRESHENLEKLKLQFDLPPHGYYWKLKVHPSLIYDYDSYFLVFEDLVVPGLGFAQTICSDPSVTAAMFGRNHVAKFHKVEGAWQSTYDILCVPSSSVAYYSSNIEEYRSYISMVQSSQNSVQVTELINKIPDAARVGSSDSAKNIMESIAVIDILNGDYDKEFKENEEIDNQPLEIPEPEPYVPYYPDFIESPVTAPEVVPGTAPEVVPSVDPESQPLPSQPSRDEPLPGTDPQENPVTRPAPGTSPSPAPSTSPSSSPISSPVRLPAFCSWATVVCDFIIWFKEESDKEETEQERPEVENIDLNFRPASFDSDYVVYGGHCPVLEPFSVPVGFGQSIVMRFDITPLCSFVISVRPAILAIAYLIAMMIVGRAIQNT